MLTEINFKRCYVNGNIAGVSTLEDGRAVLFFNGSWLTSDGIRDEFQAAGVSCHSFGSGCVIPSADLAGICAVVPGAVVDWEGSNEYNARRAAAKGSRSGGASGASTSATSATATASTGAGVGASGAAPSVDAPTFSRGKYTNIMMAAQLMPAVGADLDALESDVNAALALAAESSNKVQGYRFETTRGEYESNAKEYFHPLFAEICAEIEDNNGVYLYGPAGTGKSYMAAQVARALSLDFYTDNKLLMDYDAKGFADAAGKLVETQFFQAFTKGGLYFLDEINASSALALKVLNDALANGVFTFPVVGTVNCHENFRFMAAGNGVGVGSGFVDKYGVKYIGCNPLDDSTRDRFQAWVEVDYCNEISMAVAVPFLGAAAGEAVEFLNALRMAQKKCGLGLLVSNRPLKALCKRVARGMDITAALGLTWSMLGADKLNQLAGALECSNKWGVAFRQLAKNESKKAV